MASSWNSGYGLMCRRLRGKNISFRRIFFFPKKAISVVEVCLILGFAIIATWPFKNIFHLCMFYIFSPIYKRGIGYKVSSSWTTYTTLCLQILNPIPDVKVEIKEYCIDLIYSLACMTSTLAAFRWFKALYLITFSAPEFPSVIHAFSMLLKEGDNFSPSPTPI